MNMAVIMCLHSEICVVHVQALSTYTKPGVVRSVTLRELVRSLVQRVTVSTTRNKERSMTTLQS